MIKTPAAEYQLRSKGPPRDQSTTQPRDQSTTQPKDQSTSQPRDQSTTQPKDQSTSQPRDQSTSQPTTEESRPTMTSGPSTTGRPLFSSEQVGRFDPKIDNARSWLNRYEYFGEASGANNEILCRFFGMFLSIGAAFDWFSNLGEDIKGNFAQLKRQFLQRFSTNIDPIQTTSELFQMKQKPNQSVRDFIYSVQAKAHSADISEENILSAINGGLLSHIRADLRRTPPTTLDELIDTAEKSESAYSVHPPQMNFSEAAFTEIVKNAIGGVNMVELKEQVDLLAQKQNSINAIQKQSTSNTSDRPNHRQWQSYNNKQQHYYPNTTQQNYYHSNKQQPYYSNNKQTNYQSHQNYPKLCRACAFPLHTHDYMHCAAKSKTCYSCNKSGHIMRACRLNNQ